MPTDIRDLDVQDTYKSLLFLDNGFIGIGSDIYTVQSGNGYATALAVGADAVKINGLKYPTVDSTAGYVLTTDGAGNLTLAAPAGGSVALNDLTDVTLTASSSGQILQYDGATWVNHTLAAADVTDLATASISFTNKSGNISQWTNDSSYTTLAAVAAVGYATATSATAFTNKTGNISQWTNDSGYITTGDQLVFKTIAVAGQSDVVADTTTDTLTLAAGANVTITTNATTDTITIASSGGGGLSDADYGDVTVSSSGTVMTVDSVTVADAAADTTTWPMLSRSVTGSNQVVSTDPGLTYDASANSLATTTFVGVLTGNASTATSAATLTTPRTIGAVSFDGSANIVPTTINVANEAADTTCFPAFFNAATGDNIPKTNAALTFNASTVNLGSTTFTGALVGNASTATSAATLTTPRTIGNVSFDGSANIVPSTSVISNEATDTTCFPTFVTAATGNLDQKTNASLTFNSNTVNLGCTTFTGALSGNATTATTLQTARAIGGVNFDGSAAITPANITIANEATDTTCFPLFTTAATGDLPPKSNANLTYNSNTGAVGTTSLTLTNALTVANGGTGIATTTAYAPICGGTTSTGAWQAAGTGLATSGFVLVSGGSSAVPAFKVPCSGVVSALSDGATPALDASLGNVFTLTAAGNRTIAVPSNAVSGQKIVIRHTASGADRTLALNTGAGGFRFGTDITALTATTSAKTDYIGCIYNAADSKWDVVAYTKGF